MAYQHDVLTYYRHIRGFRAFIVQIRQLNLNLFMVLESSPISNYESTFQNKSIPGILFGVQLAENSQFYGIKY